MDLQSQHGTTEIETGPLCLGGSIAFQHCLDTNCNQSLPFCTEIKCCNMHQQCNPQKRKTIHVQAQKLKKELDDWELFLEESRQKILIQIARSTDSYRLINALTKYKENCYPKVSLPKSGIINSIYQSSQKVAQVQSQWLKYSEKNFYRVQIMHGLISLEAKQQTWNLERMLSFISQKIKNQKDQCLTPDQKRLFKILTKRQHQVLTPRKLRLLFQRACDIHPEKQQEIALIRCRVNKSLDIITKSLKSLENTIKKYFQFNLLELKILSKIVHEWREFQLIINEVLPKDLNYKRCDFLYRASQNGFSARKFHQNCDNHPNTLTLIELENGMKIAVYASLAWKSTGHYDKDPQAKIIIFNLSNKKRFEVDPNQGPTYYDKDTGPSFGSAPELQLSDKCDKNYNSSCGLTSEYKNEYFHYNNEDIMLKSIGNLYGKSTFKTKGYEVFQFL